MYYGWGNWGTWALYMRLTQSQHCEQQARAAASGGAECLRQMIEQSQPAARGWYMDILDEALHSVDWRALAEALSQ